MVNAIFAFRVAMLILLQAAFLRANVIRGRVNGGLTFHLTVSGRPALDVRRGGANRDQVSAIVLLNQARTRDRDRGRLLRLITMVRVFTSGFFFSFRQVLIFSGYGRFIRPVCVIRIRSANRLDRGT